MWLQGTFKETCLLIWLMPTASKQYLGYSDSTRSLDAPGSAGKSIVPPTTTPQPYLGWIAGPVIGSAVLVGAAAYAYQRMKTSKAGTSASSANEGADGAAASGDVAETAAKYAIGQTGPTPPRINVEAVQPTNQVRCQKMVGKSNKPDCMVYCWIYKDLSCGVHISKGCRCLICRVCYGS